MRQAERLDEVVVLRELLKWFCDRADGDGVNSVRTYRAFRYALRGALSLARREAGLK